VRDVALGELHTPFDCSWELELSTAGRHLLWRVQTARSRDTTGAADQPRFGRRSGRADLLEEAIQDLDSNEYIVKRSPDEFLYLNKSITQLTKAISSISLLDDLNDLKLFFWRINISHADAVGTTPVPITAEGVDAALEGFTKTGSDSDILRLALMFQEKVPKHFDLLKDRFRETFPTVEDIRIDVVKASLNNTSVTSELAALIKEKGTKGWIPLHLISTGMRRSLILLFEIGLLPDTVFLLDDFENGLGVNCIDQVTDFILDPPLDDRIKSGNVQQIIVTSHHPYIINHIPMENWRVVTRHGSVVRAVAPEDIPGLRGDSRHEAFLRLLNTGEYRHGIS
jgi:hypothetical protein